MIPRKAFQRSRGLVPLLQKRLADPRLYSCRLKNFSYTSRHAASLACRIGLAAHGAFSVALRASLSRSRFFPPSEHSRALYLRSELKWAIGVLRFS
jgi:hypothetical protein